MKYLALEQIKAHMPCVEQYRAAVKFFGKRKRVAVTKKNALAAAQRFNFDWLARRLLSVSALRAYTKAIPPVQKLHNEANVLASLVSVQKAYNEAKALTFVKAFNSMKGPQ